MSHDLFSHSVLSCVRIRAIVERVNSVDAF